MKSHEIHNSTPDEPTPEQKNKNISLNKHIKQSRLTPETAISKTASPTDQSEQPLQTLQQSPNEADHVIGLPQENVENANKAKPRVKTTVWRPVTPT